MAPHVLIVDADTSVAQITSAVVRHITPGITLATETTPERGWVSARQTPPDIVIIDPAPHPSAALYLIQRCHQLQMPPHTVILTSVSTSTLRASAQQLGVKIYMEKPADLVELIEQLRMLVAQTPDQARSYVPEQSVPEQFSAQSLWYL